MTYTQDEFFINETLKLAKKGVSWTYPNPMVGALIVKGGRMIGKGYHKVFGLPHAEIEALQKCKENPKGATLYVNLEPCSHFGKTPPCVDTIIQAGITRVVCATLDPNPKVRSFGLAKLQKAGIEVLVGVLESEARTLNEAFFTFHEKKRPFIALKFAASLDGKIATRTGESKWITNEKARKYARSLRGQYQAVLVGINTVLKDNPHLGVRMKGKKDPLRIILGQRVQIPDDAQVLRDQNVLIIKAKKIHDLLSVLREKEIISILVEGGGSVLGSFVDAKVVDKVYAFHAPILVGGKKAISAIAGQGVQTISQSIHLKNLSYKRFDDNLLTIGYVV
ncbi:bifunctional diaminohydroxyphosphoribosylaminopyrimidine deaminase/5-amino-6-(5-phosphoribosylamino)uracil reductase RibD [Candidatus Daviesbacteria bacterium]|nr:bifunctional diaminohydroxyphosphoribosylaminopyrimidine deaminase/5-amino-6-(5-phosphoribosylamino)uracil reductase RibD [Candidatus Daviesbacteria bacterium]